MPRRATRKESGVERVAVRPDLEPTVADMREMVQIALARITGQYAALEGQPALGTSARSEDVAATVREPMPEDAERYEAVLDRLFDDLLPESFNTISPGSLAYIPSGGVFHAAVADLISSTMNRYVAYRPAAPALAEIDATVVRWFADLVGLPHGSGGVLTSGGSMSSLAAIVAAREAILGERFLDGVVYVSDQTHHSIRKVARIAGFPAAHVRVVPSTDAFTIDLTALMQAIERDREAGLRPFCVVGNAGTTSTGAVDDLETLADMVSVYRMWLHVDAAYGGFFLLTDRGRRALAGIERADSVILDPHKSLFLPYGIGCVLVRDQQTLLRAHSEHSDYIDAVPQDDPGFRPNAADLSPELTRSFRGLRAWLPLKTLGAGRFRDALDEKLDLARWAAAALREVRGVEIVAAPQLSTLAFRIVEAGRDPLALDALNQEILDRLNARGRVHLSGTRLRGRFAMRVCVLGVRTHRDRLEMLVEDLRASVRESLDSHATLPVPAAPPGSAASSWPPPAAEEVGR